MYRKLSLCMASTYIVTLYDTWILTKIYSKQKYNNTWLISHFTSIRRLQLQLQSISGSTDMKVKSGINSIFKKGTKFQLSCIKTKLTTFVFCQCQVCQIFQWWLAMVFPLPAMCQWPHKMLLCLECHLHSMVKERTHHLMHGNSLILENIIL